MQGLGEDSVRASSPIWASVASRARTRSLLACYGGQNELSNTRNAYFVHIFNTFRLTSAREKLLLKIPLTVLFDQRHFDNASAVALFHGGHLVKRSERLAMES